MGMSRLPFGGVLEGSEYVDSLPSTCDLTIAIAASLREMTRSIMPCLVRERVSKMLGDILRPVKDTDNDDLCIRFTEINHMRAGNVFQVALAFYLD